ncbi:MAG TPA: hypothetical protein VN277_09095, partial [Acidiferrobacterales bacterium]|nr:hypothetical protein [Acidiferrobacterales bacterium]
MSQRDIDLALALLRRQLPHLRLPARIKSQGFPSHSRCLGQYRYLSDTLKLNERYLAPLDNAGALDLLDTLIHELLHKNSRWTRQVRDTLFRHPEIDAEAARLTR